MVTNTNHHRQPHQRPDLQPAPQPAPQPADQHRPAAGSDDPLLTLHQHLLALTVTPTNHDPVATLVDVTTALRETATDALSQHTPIDRWQAVAGVLHTSGALYQELARALAHERDGIHTGLQSTCPTCGCPILTCTTVPQAARALEAHANTAHKHRSSTPQPRNR